MLLNIRMRFLLLILTTISISCATKKKLVPTKNTTNRSYAPKNVKIYEQTSRKTLGPCEPSIAINPSNPQNIVAGSVLDYVHVSNDGGKVWNTKKLKSPLGIWGDPTVLSDSKGVFYYFHLSDPEGTNWKSKKMLDRIVIQKSSDGGQTWSEGTGIGLNFPKQQDKQWGLIHPKKENQIYTAWTEFDKYNSADEKDKSRILFSKSNDSSKTWSSPIQISTHQGNCLDDDHTPEGTTLTSDGKNLYISWAYNSKIWFAKSSDNGDSWSKEITVADQPNGWKYEIENITRCNGFPVMTTDLSKSKNNGAIYLNWSSQIDSTQTDIFISKSIDQGKTWSTPKTISENKEAAHHFFNWMTVDPKTGYIYIVYYKEIKPNSSLIEVHLSVSKNGAESFSDYIISEKPFNPSGSNFFGDYNNINAYNGMVRPIWTQVENGLVSVWTALINEKALRK